MMIWTIGGKTLRKGDGIGLRIEKHRRRKRRWHTGFTGYRLKRTIVHDLFGASEEGVELFSRLDLGFRRDVFEDSPTGTDQRLVDPSLVRSSRGNKLPFNSERKGGLWSFAGGLPFLQPILQFDGCASKIGAIIADDFRRITTAIGKADQRIYEGGRSELFH